MCARRARRCSNRCWRTWLCMFERLGELALSSDDKFLREAFQHPGSHHCVELGCGEVFVGRHHRHRELATTADDHLCSNLDQSYLHLGHAQSIHNIHSSHAPYGSRWSTHAICASGLPAWRHSTHAPETCAPTDPQSMTTPIRQQQSCDRISGYHGALAAARHTCSAPPLHRAGMRHRTRPGAAELNSHTRARRDGPSTISAPQRLSAAVVPTGALPITGSDPGSHTPNTILRNTILPCACTPR